MESIRLHLCLRTIRNSQIYGSLYESRVQQIDVKTMVLNKYLGKDKKVYMQQLEGFNKESKENLVLKPKKSQSGLKEASRTWNLCFDKVMKA